MRGCRRFSDLEKFCPKRGTTARVTTSVRGWACYSVAGAHVTLDVIKITIVVNPLTSQNGNSTDLRTASVTT